MISALETRNSTVDTTTIDEKNHELIECLNAMGAGKFNQLPSGSGEIAQAVRQLAETLQKKSKRRITTDCQPLFDGK